MRKPQVNLIIDAVLFLCLAAVAGIGFLINYVLVPGTQRWEIYGRNVDLLFWGLDRHGWGTVHYVIGLVFVALLVLHVILHWRMIVGISQKLIPNRGTRRFVATLLIVSAVLLALLPIFAKPEVQERGRRSLGRYWEADRTHNASEGAAHGRDAQFRTRFRNTHKFIGRQGLGPQCPSALQVGTGFTLERVDETCNPDMVRQVLTCPQGGRAPTDAGDRRPRERQTREDAYPGNMRGAQGEVTGRRRRRRSSLQRSVLPFGESAAPRKYQDNTPDMRPSRRRARGDPRSPEREPFAS